MKNGYQMYLLVLYFLINAQCSFSQNHSFTDKYNFNFELRKSSWTFEPMLPVVIELDSTQTIHGKNPLCLAQVKFGKPTLKGALQHSILLPATKADSLTVYLNCKSKNLQNARLIVSGINEREGVLYSDTLSLLGSKEWQIFSRSVPIKDVAILHLSIEAEGIKSNSEQRLSLDKIEIKIDGKDINDFQLPTIPSFPDIKKSDIISLSFSDNSSYSKLPDLENRKIVAIGETIHGSETITEAAAQLIKYQVKYNNCKLILLEIPTEQTFLWNRFIQGDNLYTKEDLTQDFTHFRFSPRIMLDLFNWLKQYNEKVKDKVWLLGMDQEIGGHNSEIYLFDYIYRINENKHHLLLDSLCLKLLDPKTFPQALQILDKNKDIEKLLGEKEYKILYHCLNMLIASGENPLKHYAIREDNMYLNATFLLNLLCPKDEKAIIYAHFLHTNYKNRDPRFPFLNSFGSNMKNKFGNNYYSIAVLT